MSWFVKMSNAALKTLMSQYSKLRNAYAPAIKHLGSMRAAGQKVTRRQLPKTVQNAMEQLADLRAQIARERQIAQAQRVGIPNVKALSKLPGDTKLTGLPVPQAPAMQSLREAGSQAALKAPTYSPTAQKAFGRMQGLREARPTLERYGLT